MNTLFKTDRVEKFAELSPCGMYRYSLSRVWNDDKDDAVFVMLNPSVADDKIDDPTIRRCMGFASDWDYGGITVVNLFAFRATDPQKLTTATDPFGPGNSDHIIRACTAAGIVVVAWGAAKIAIGPGKFLTSFLTEHRVRLHCLGKTKEGFPRHPLYVPAATKPEPWGV